MYETMGLQCRVARWLRIVCAANRPASASRRNRCLALVIYCSDIQEISILKAHIRRMLDEKFCSSIRQLHWVATFCDPGFRTFSFLPNATSEDEKLKKDLLEAIPKWIESLAGDAEADVDENVSDEPPAPKRPKSFFGSMRNPGSNVGLQQQQSTLHHEYDAYLHDEIFNPFNYDEEDLLS